MEEDLVSNNSLGAHNFLFYSLQQADVIIADYSRVLTVFSHDSKIGCFTKNFPNYTRHLKVKLIDYRK